MIPADPSASYLDEGLVITSTLSMSCAGRLLNPSASLIPTNPDGWPLIKIRTPSLPLRDTFPSTSTETEGTLSSTSCAVPPLLVRSFPTLNTRLSRVNVVSDFSAVI